MEITRKGAKIRGKQVSTKSKVGYFYLSSKIKEPLKGLIKETLREKETNKQEQKGIATDMTETLKLRECYEELQAKQIFLKSFLKKKKKKNTQIFLRKIRKPVYR